VLFARYGQSYKLSFKRGTQKLFAGAHSLNGEEESWGVAEGEEEGESQ
jgi:hypothetical protein